jgi:G3E family GTPase
MYLYMSMNIYSIYNIHSDIFKCIYEKEEEQEDAGHSHEGHVHDEHCGHLVHDEHCGHAMTEALDHAHADHHEIPSVEAHNGHNHKEIHNGHDHKEARNGHDHLDTNHHAFAHEKKADLAAYDHKEEPKPVKRVKKTHNLSLVSSVGFTIEGLLDVLLFNKFMSNLLQEKAPDFYRTKGILAFSNQGDIKFVYQGVHEQVNFGPAEHDWKKGEIRISKMIFIGKNIDYEFLKTGLQACAEHPDSAVVTMHKR